MNDRLESLSDKVRMGISIDFSEALEVIEYQECLRLRRDNTVLRRIMRWLRALLAAQAGEVK